MNPTPEMLSFSQTAIGLFVLWLWYWYIGRRFLLERLRQDLFRIRDRLFDQAANIPGAFSDPAYIDCRQTINGFIRVAYMASPLQVLALWLTSSADDVSERPACARQDLVPHLNEAISKAIARLYRYVFWEHVIAGPMLWVAFKCGQVLRYGPKKQQPLAATRPFRILESEARTFGGNSALARQLVGMR